MEENHANFKTTIHVDLAFKDGGSVENTQLFHYIMHKIDNDWPWVIGSNTRPDILVYKRTLCRVCLGRVWRAQPFKSTEVGPLLHKLAKQFGLSVRYILMSGHHECLEYALYDTKEVGREGVLDLHSASDLGVNGLYERCAN